MQPCRMAGVARAGKAAGQDWPQRVLNAVLRNFLIVGTQRTGSTALVRSLTFHPEIACADEWTQRVHPHRKLAFTARALAGDFSELTAGQRSRIEPKFGENTRWLGFKVLFRSSDKWVISPRFAPALWMDRLGGFRKWLAARPQVHVIHIVRRDSLDWLKSKYLADKSRAYAAGRSYPEGMTVEIPIAEAIRRLEAKDWLDARLALLARTNPYLCISYEEFLESDRAVVMRLMEFLDCDAGKLGEFDYRKQQKQAKRSAREYISNYDALADALARRSKG